MSEKMNTATVDRTAEYPKGYSPAEQWRQQLIDDLMARITQAFDAMPPEVRAAYPDRITWLAGADGGIAGVIDDLLTFHAPDRD